MQEMKTQTIAGQTFEIVDAKARAAIANLQGGGVAQNFQVVAYASENDLLAAAPVENTIGVVTTTPIAKTILSDIDPSAATEGAVWLQTGSGSIPISTLTSGNVDFGTVYPIAARQCIDGAWVNVAAKSYRNGEWIPLWNGELFDGGNQYERFTGGWIRNTDFKVQNFNNSGGSCEIGETIFISSGNNVCTVVTTAQKIDVTNRKTISFSIDANNSANGTCVFAISQASGSVYNADALTEFAVATKDEPVTLDVSGINIPVYIGFSTVNNRKYTVYKINME
jgi:hypothetical protein